MSRHRAGAGSQSIEPGGGTSNNTALEALPAARVDATTYTSARNRLRVSRRG
ncbi:hypothetical protein [Amycolatopsis sp. NPDC059657]|uniref:hypothetical protein n=1 Tax=Amycolatopsis sp. NPDC059657 TaxID=3346899 RepID=UPI00366B0886